MFTDVDRFALKITLLKPNDFIEHIHTFIPFAAMGDGREKLAQFIAELEGSRGNDMSRATSPGGGPSNGEDRQDPRRRPRKYPYFRYLPYKVEQESEREKNLDEIIKQLYVAIEAGDFAPGAIHWTRELRSWLGLKFDPTKEQRTKLVKLYYELALAPGVDTSAVERFSSMFMVLTKYVFTVLRFYSAKANPVVGANIT